MQISIVKEGEPIGKIIKGLGAKNLPATTRAIKIAANTVMSEWVKAVKSAKIIGKKGSSYTSWKNSYIKAIKMEKQTDPLKATISAEGMYVNFVENGIKRFDMKTGFLNGPKARRNAKGEPYNIIFIRKGAPSTARISQMPSNVYTSVKQMDKGEANKRYRVIGVGDKVPLMQATNLKQRVHSSGAARYAGKGKKDKSAGMVKGGSKGHTQYGTFRIVTKNSKGWIFPRIKGAKVFDNLVEKIEPKIKKILQDGIIKDTNAGMEYLKSQGF